MKLKKSAHRAVSNGKLDAAVLKLFSMTPEKTYNYRQVAAAFNLRGADRGKVVDILMDLEGEGLLIREGESGRYRLNNKSRHIFGTIERDSIERKYFLVVEGSKERIPISENGQTTAMPGDYVEASVLPKKRYQSRQAEVIKVIKHTKEEFVGILDMPSNRAAFLVVDKKYLRNDIYIKPENLHGAKNGDRCLVHITQWETSQTNPEGEVIEVFGKVGDNNAEMHAILAEFNLPYKYPQEVESAANDIDATITDDEIAKRWDMRGDITFTIDPRDAKDFDDALSIEPIGENKWRIGVHIADVTHYVTEDSIIEQEAFKRATSIYLVDRTIPMLPERLCNNICSLRPDEDKLAYSVVYTMDDTARVLDYKICRTIIRSNRRFTYEQAQEIIETKTGDFAEQILKLNELAQILRANRFAAGAISFDRTEVQFEIDENGKPLSVYFKESKEANKLIEEFMLLANKTVATHIGKKMKGKEGAPTFVYRVHDVPNPDKLEQLGLFVGRLGLKFKSNQTGRSLSTAFNRLLADVKGKPCANLIETLAVRSMAKASYTTNNIGHYGLAFDFYTHFTSPIRRYPDMMVHRLITHYLDGGKSADAVDYEQRCEHSSDMENVAAQAERASIKYKQVEFMADKIGQIFDGVISGVTEWGFFVELNENKCEGFVPVRTLEDDFYEYDAQNIAIIGRHNKRKYQLGQAVTVRITHTDLIKKQLDVELV